MFLFINCQVLSGYNVLRGERNWIVSFGGALCKWLRFTASLSPPREPATGPGNPERCQRPEDLGTGHSTPGICLSTEVITLSGSGWQNSGGLIMIPGHHSLLLSPERITLL